MEKVESNSSEKKELRGYVCTKPLDSSSPLILSDTLPTGPFSFLDPKFQKEKPRLPPPVYLSMGMITMSKPKDKAQALKGLEITSNGELKLTDEEILKKQRGVILDVIKKLAKNVLEGKGVVGLSLPVRIFEPRSTLERLIDWWLFAPIYLSAAGKATDPVVRMKNVIAFMISGLHLSASQLKPFNPLLGETYQGTFEDGTQIYCEHTSHHPPIANFLLINPDYKYYGRYEFVAKLSQNKLYIRQVGPNIVEFNDKSKIVFHLPGIKAKGMIMGDRSCYYHGVSTFVDPTHKIKTVIKFSSGKKTGSFFNKKKRRDEFEGKIYYYKEHEKKKAFKSKKEEHKEELKFYDLEKEICDISGSFLEKLCFNDEEFWNIDKVLPSRAIPSEDPLPSDVRFREDLIWLKYGNLKNAEDWKLRLEEQQRWDRKLRLKEK
jgi:Oxysterol-binding protein.